MNFVTFLFLPVFGFSQLADAKMYFKPPKNGVPFMVYFKSTQRAVCAGTMVSRQVVLTAAACVFPPYIGAKGEHISSGPISVVVGTKYRHPRRGIKIQVVKILFPKNLLSEDPQIQMVRLESSMVLLVLKRKVSDLLTEVPVRSILVDYLGHEELFSHSSCLTAGWHFFGPYDQIIGPGIRFRMYRNLRVQMMDVVKPDSMFCDTLVIKYRMQMVQLFGEDADIDESAMICIRDPDRQSQPCFGMVGAPLVCEGKVVAVFSMYNGQWENCTGHTNIYHRVSSDNMKTFMECTASLFEPMMMMDMNKMHKTDENMYYFNKEEASETYDQISTRNSDSDEDGSDWQLPKSVRGRP